MWLYVFRLRSKSDHWWVILLVLCQLAIGISSSQAQQSGPFSYTSNGIAVTITGYSGAGGEVTLPSVIAGLAVREVGQGAFASKASITRVVVPDSIQTIGGYAFSRCTGLTSISLADSVETIGLAAFADCTALASATIPPKVKSLASVFTRCTRLTEVVLPTGMANLAYAFEDCTALASIEIPMGTTQLGIAVFKGCTNLASVNLPGGLLSISDNCFFGCRKLSSISLPDTLRTIGYSAFDGCSSLVTVVIPAAVTWMRKYAFYDCTSLKSATFEGDAPALDANAFINAAPGFTIYFSASRQGFTSPVWQGYPALAIIPPASPTPIDILGISSSPGAFTMVIAAKAGIRYQLQHSINPAAGSWQPIGEPASSPGDQPLELIHQGPPAQHGFYRATSAPP